MALDLTTIFQTMAFVGPTICYAFLQSAGLVNDHLRGCFRFRELTGAA